ncbi:threonine/homoserine/homoserine lactone efflux protein [Sporosarcina luteola]|nr:threonine/homoserine/homoserine lactone efflux protein [Sporosarcina luteola]
MKIYAFKQFVSVLTLLLIAFIVDYFIQNAHADIESVVLKQLIMFITISILLFVCNLLLYNYARKEENFMQHKIWNKMFILILGWLMISFILFIVMFFTTPLDDLLSLHPWMMFIVIDYFLFFINLFVLSVVHILVDRSMKIEKKIVITWASSSLAAAIILFLIPSL